MFSRFFIERPIFAAVIAIVIVIAGVVSLVGLPIAQYPEITPPTVNVSANYPGANAEVVSATVAQPIEEQVNGVEHMLYMSSTCSADGSYSLTVTFEVGTDLDIATVLVQNRVGIATAKLPEEVKRLGVTTQKQSPNMVELIALRSPDGRYDDLYLSNFANMRIKDELARTPGVGFVKVFGVGDYSMRIWLDPEKMDERGVTTTDVFNAIREQNVQVAAGQIGAPPAPPGQAFQYTVNVKGRLTDPKEFGNIIVRSLPGGRNLYVKDVARVELGSKSYAYKALLDGKPTAILGIYQTPGANALDVAARIHAKMEELKKTFPEGLEYSVPLDTTLFIADSIHEVVVTLFVAVLLVFVTLFIFLQDWRTTIIPGVAIPVSLIGTFMVMAAMGFSINMISLFGLVLAIGIVVDDAIVVVENTDRNINEKGLAPRAAAIAAMEEVGGAVVATTLVLLAVFVPTAFMPGITGRLFKQFALTISAATVISSINALTLSPALAALLLRPANPDKKVNVFFRAFNRIFDASTRGYTATVRGLVRKSAVSMLLAIVIGVLAMWGFGTLPTGFLPTEDQGYVYGFAQLPDAATLNRSARVGDELSKRIAAVPGVQNTVAIDGYSLLDNATLSNTVTFFISFKPFEDRLPEGHTMNFILGQLQKIGRETQAARFVAFAPPAIPGLGNSGGFEMMLQDRTGAGPQLLQRMAEAVAGAANTQTGLQGVYTTFRATTPQLFVDVDRTAAKMVGVPLNDIFGTLQTYLGSAYVNDFTEFGRNFQVNLQADSMARSRIDDIVRLKVRNREGRMIPLGTFLDTRFTLGPQVMTRYNLYPAANVNGNPAPGFSSGQALELMEDLTRRTIPSTMGFEWTGMSYQEKIAASGGMGTFIMSIVFVFLVLAAQYESWSVPLGVIMVVPLSVLGVSIALFLRGMEVNTYTQIGLVLLVALAAKNAILIVEFAKQLHDGGMGIFEAAAEAARLRFRPILMTSLAFVLGTFPLVIASGAGAASRQAAGTAVFGGQIAAIIMAVLFVPVFWAVIARLSGTSRGDGSRAALEHDGDA
ncbi:MAG: multidrug efflux RND transporter permease subunit [Acidobacteria bacterium]|nr:multidrug efflux RND transporter permease subunit [Acidobacteriota bacterium]